MSIPFDEFAGKVKAFFSRIVPRCAGPRSQSSELEKARTLFNNAQSDDMNSTKVLDPDKIRCDFRDTFLLTVKSLK